MAKIVIWTPEQASQELHKRLAFCIDSRKTFEYQWEENERTVFNTKGRPSQPNVSVSFESEVQLGISDVDGSNPNVGVNYAFKNTRLIHSQLSANPPTVVTRPTSNDPSDRRKADAADRLIRFAIRKYQMQETFDRTSLNTLIYGTGIVKTIWDPEKGDIVDFDETSGELTMEGDIDFTVPSPWDIYIDPDATSIDEIKYVFERIHMPYEEALYKFPQHKEILDKYRLTEETRRTEYGTNRNLNEKRYDVVEIYQYWEKGLPYNGMIGRFCFMTRNAELLSDVGPNPMRFSPPKNRGVEGLGDGVDKPLPAKAVLPYHIFTDVDIPGTVWGRAVVAYETSLQETYNKMFNVMLDNLHAHGVARMILPEGAEIADGAVTNSPWDIIKITGTQPPHFMEPMPLPAAFPQLIQQAKQGIDDMAGVNEAMFGQQSREQSGFLMQYATNQANLIRHRLFNKYVMMTESVYRFYLNLIRKYWEESRVIHVLGKEKAFEAVDIKGADIDGGFDLTVEYGASLSLDPTTRRTEVLNMMPLFEKAGISTRTILQMIKLNELEGLYDKVQLAADRQRELFEEMLAKDIYIAPRDLQDHKNMLEYSYEYVMTTEYKYLPPEQQALIDRHIKEREQMPAAGGGPAGPLPAVPGAAGPLDVMQMGAKQQA